MFSHFLTDNFLLQNILILITSYLICFFSMKYFLKIIDARNICRQPIRKEGPQAHLKEKKNTPTMGGLVIVFSTLLTTTFLIDISNYYIQAILFVFLAFSLIGFIDDFLKVRGQNTKGFRGSVKLIIQFFVVGSTIIFLQYQNSIYLNSSVIIPFIDKSINIGQLYILFVIIVVVGTANSVNLTDGLDGLVSVPVIISLISLAILAYIVNDLQLLRNFNLKFIKNSSDIILLCFAVIGSLLAFLKYNLKPAKIFMGDVGSLGIGAMLGIITVILKIELVFFIISLLFVIEATSVILQVSYYKLTKKRMFLMAPIHHHFEKLGWGEKKVVRVFWLASLIFGIIGLLGIL